MFLCSLGVYLFGTREFSVILQMFEPSYLIFSHPRIHSTIYQFQRIRIKSHVTVEYHGIWQNILENNHRKKESYKKCIKFLTLNYLYI
jgi:hypothetical protein